uniref:Uncharacterized protein n=1 Tax=Candidatus Kentrum sp. TUN TaxID=2126343 RepID=A0A451A1P3_9GAMM|nr:MAG: hypothetical protein BECKTUN1418F_GA0071002_11922 [Candidatus Kentron sp. TUN]VFK69034.1 MAG: hypothetical protein BECKTUN1418E_GA0071001_11902 [Candidatus Kentron sp. TUN]
MCENMLALRAEIDRRCSFAIGSQDLRFSDTPIRTSRNQKDYQKYVWPRSSKAIPRKLRTTIRRFLVFLHVFSSVGVISSAARNDRSFSRFWVAA